jgi:hypothetical protein
MTQAVTYCFNNLPFGCMVGLANSVFDGQGIAAAMPDNHHPIDAEQWRAPDFKRIMLAKDPAKGRTHQKATKFGSQAVIDFIAYRVEEI